MTDESMKDLVSKHDTAITQLVTSVEHLVASQKVTNDRLEEISKALLKQIVIKDKIEALEKNTQESLKRVHNKIDKVENTQNSDRGCNGVRLLIKDKEAITKDVTKLIGNCEEYRIRIDQLDRRVIPKAVLLWVVGIGVTYTVMFGTYTVQTLNKIDKTNARLTTLIERDVKDVNRLMERKDG